MRTKQEIHVASAHAYKGVVLVCGAKVRNNMCEFMFICFYCITLYF